MAARWPHRRLRSESETLCYRRGVAVGHRGACRGAADALGCHLVSRHQPAGADRRFPEGPGRRRGDARHDRARAARQPGHGAHRHLVERVRLPPRSGARHRHPRQRQLRYLLRRARHDERPGARLVRRVGDYDRLDGLNLRDGTLVSTANQFRDESAPFDTESLSMKIRTSTMSFFGAYGVTDRLEIGGVVPLVQLNIDGSRVNVYRGTSIVQATGSASASGLADMALRAKYLLVSSRNAGFAAAGEVRLPTGDEAALLGAGRAALKIMAIGSVENPRVGAHGNFAIVRGGAS